MYIIETSFLPLCVDTCRTIIYLPRNDIPIAIRFPFLTFDKQISFRRGLQHDGMQPVDLRMKKSHNFAWFQREMFVCGTRKRNKLLNLDLLKRQDQNLRLHACILTQQLLQI